MSGASWASPLRRAPGRHEPAAAEGPSDFFLELSFQGVLDRRIRERRSNLMKYALLIYAAEKDWAGKSKEEQGKIYNEYMAYTVELKKSGKLLSCEPLDPTSTATTIRVRSGKTVPTDGPFADTKEQLGRR